MKIKRRLMISIIDFLTGRLDIDYNGEDLDRDDIICDVFDFIESSKTNDRIDNNIVGHK